MPAPSTALAAIERAGETMGEAETIFAASAVAIGDVALAIEGPPGIGKSSLALALIDQGAVLIGDDAVRLTKSDAKEDGHLVASPPPNIEGLIELRGIGLFEMPLSPSRPLALVLSLGVEGERLPERAIMREILGVTVPTLPFSPGTIAPALRAQMALTRFGQLR